MIQFQVRLLSTSLLRFATVLLAFSALAAGSTPAQATDTRACQGTKARGLPGGCAKGFTEWDFPQFRCPEANKVFYLCRRINTCLYYAPANGNEMFVLYKSADDPTGRRRGVEAKGKKTPQEILRIEGYRAAPTTKTNDACLPEAGEVVAVTDIVYNQPGQVKGPDAAAATAGATPPLTDGPETGAAPAAGVTEPVPSAERDSAAAGAGEHEELSFLEGGDIAGALQTAGTSKPQALEVIPGEEGRLTTATNNITRFRDANGNEVTVGGQPVFKGTRNGQEVFAVGNGCASGNGACQMLRAVDRDNTTPGRPASRDDVLAAQRGANGFSQEILGSHQLANSPSNPGTVTDPTQTVVDANLAEQQRAAQERQGAPGSRQQAAGTRSHFRGDFNYRNEIEDGPCGASKTLYEGEARYDCESKEKRVEMSQVANQLASASTNVVTTAMGQSTITKVQKEGSQSAAVAGAARMQKNTGTAQVITGGMNAMLGVIQYRDGTIARNNAKSLDPYTKRDSKAFKVQGTGIKRNGGEQFNVVSNNELGKKLEIAKSEDFSGISNVHYNSGAAAQSMNLNHMNNQARSIGKKAQSEQDSVSQKSKAGGMMSAMVGAQQLASGIANIAAARELAKAAEKMKNIEGAVGNLPGVDPSAPSDPLAPRQGQTISGDGMPEEVAAISEETVPEEENNNPFGDDFNPNGSGGDMAGTPPVPGNVRTNNSVPNGSGGSGGLGGAGSAPSLDAAGEEGAAQYAENRPSTSDYEGSGGVGMVGGRGGGGGGSNDGGGIDFSSLLAQFLPQGEEEEKPSNGILDFGGRRSLAQEQPESLLDRGANIFERISETYMDKTKRGYVGL